METIFSILQETWAIRALAASSMVGVMCGVLGCFIVLRNMSLVGDALAHAILPGVVVAYLILGYSTLGFFTGSVLAGLATAVGITWIQHRVQTKNDAAIGIVFTAMFSLGVIGISKISRGEGVHLDLKDFLFGNVLGVADTDLWLTALVLLYVLLSIAFFYRYLFASTFQPVVAETMGIPVRLIHYFLMLLLSFAVVASLQTVGVILVVAMLITPAATALLWSNRLQRVVWLAGAIGLLSAVLGLLVAIVFETTPGPAMAIVATLFYLATVIFAPRKGLLAKTIRRWQLRSRIDREDILKGLYRAQRAGKGADHLRDELELSLPNWQRQIRKLRKLGLLSAGRLALTTKGEAAARQLVRAHRLWETYLADRVGLDENQIHSDAERYEHLLPQSLLDEVEATLGYPSVDPHGSPIPLRSQEPAFSLGQLVPGQRATLAEYQTSEHISARLWEEQLQAGALIEFLTIEDQDALLRVDQRELRIPVRLAQQINVVPEAAEKPQ
jgi:ABC-type Mn2+/Zn2+ transport system permease subunit/Mn-dependent DtxR family transcriptional regulator